MAEQNRSTRPPLPPDAKEVPVFKVCPTCGETYDESWADLAFFHNSGHTVTDAPHVRGIRISEEDLPEPPPPIPGRCNIVVLGERCDLPAGHPPEPNGVMVHRHGDATFGVIETDEPDPYEGNPYPTEN